MLTAIIYNPYRILGVYADASESEVLEASARLLSHPDSICETDFSISGLPKVKRDADTISIATKSILDSEESCLYKLFWFVKPASSEGLKYLKEGKLTEARKTWAFNTRNDSKHNVMVCCLIEGLYDLAVRCVFTNIFNQDYRQTVLLTSRSFLDILNGFKNKFYDVSNDASVPPGLAMSWKQYIQDNILTSLSKTINDRFLQPAKNKIEKGIPSSYFEAISTLILSHRQNYLFSLKYFADDADNRYCRLMQELADTIRRWIDEYLSISKDIFKYSNVQSAATIFSMYAPDGVLRSYLNLLSSILQDTRSFKISTDVCDLCHSTAFKLFHFYSENKGSAAAYRSLIEQTAHSFYEVQQRTVQARVCYQDLANLMADIGLDVIEKNLAGNLTKQTLADCGDVLCYIERAIDEKLLYGRIREKRNLTKKRLGSLGLGTPNATQSTLQHDGRNEKGQINKTTTRPSRKDSIYSSSPVEKASLIKSTSVYIFILIALIIDVLLGIVLGNTIMLGVGLAIAFAYILFIFLAEKGFDKEAKKLAYIYVIAHTVVSIVGLIVLI